MKSVIMGAAVTPGTVLDENASLNQFYAFTATLSSNKHVRFIAKNDEADIIDWHFKYRGRQLTLQYNMYNGVSLFPQNVKDQQAVQELLAQLRGRSMAH